LEQQLVLQFDVTAPDDYDDVLSVEEQLTAGLDEMAEVEGHNVGARTMHVFLWCDDAAETFAEVRNIVDAELLDRARAGWRHADGERFTPLWPPGLDAFDVS
jgi:hypothetical protein